MRCCDTVSDTIKRAKGGNHVRRRAFTAARCKTSQTKRRGALVPGVRGGYGHLQQGSSYDGAAACLEVARSLRCDSDGSKHAWPRRQGGKTRGATHQSHLSGTPEQKTTHHDPHHAHDHAAFETRGGGPGSPAQFCGVSVHTEREWSLHCRRRRGDSDGGGRLDSHSLDDMAWRE